MTRALGDDMRPALGSGKLRPAIGSRSAGVASAVILALPSNDQSARSRLEMPARFAAVATTKVVNCAAGDRLQASINSALPGDILLVQGTCNENITVQDEAVRITVDGQGTGAINGPNATAATITVLGRNITFKRLLITGGRQGFNVLRGGSALIDGNTVQASAGAGILVLQNGHARIVNNTIRLNPNTGITVQENSMARIGFLDVAGPVMGNVIESNGIAGVLIQRGGVGSLVGNAISANEGPGVSVSGTSHADLSGNHIDGNDSDGVAVSQNSDVQLGEGSGIFAPANETAIPNGGAGLRCSLNASVNGSLGSLAGLEGPKKFDSSCANGPKIR
jgi:hypothetical protein